MAAIRITNPIPGAMGIVNSAGAPSAGTSKIQTITFGGTITASATSGFYITFDGYTTPLILWSATNATLVSNIDTAVEALANVGSGGMTTAVGTMTAGIGTITMTSAGNLAKLAHNTFTVTSALEGTAPTVAITETTAGVSATARGGTIGTLVDDDTNGKLYINTGTATVPVWTVVGAQT